MTTHYEEKSLGPNADRYEVEAALGADWHQYDTNQDAWYFGVWVNHAERTIVTFAEGDLITVRCDTNAEYKEEIERMAAFYGCAPPFMITIADDGEITKHYQQRPQPGA